MNDQDWDDLPLSSQRLPTSQPEPPAQSPTPPAHAWPSALRDDQRAALDRQLSAEGRMTSNMALVVGRLYRQRTDGRPRFSRTELGALRQTYRLEIQEVLVGAEGATTRQFVMALDIPAAIVPEGITDGQRVKVYGPLRCERRYDGNFARDDLDPGLPSWELHLDIVAVEPAGELPEGSLIKLIGEVQRAPRIYVCPAGYGASSVVAAVLLHHRTLLPSPFPGARPPARRHHHRAGGGAGRQPAGRRSAAAAWQHDGGRRLHRPVRAPAPRG